MNNIICIAGSPCCGKTTLCNSLASLHNGISIDLEYLRTMFFEEDFVNNVYKYTHNEPIKENEDLRAYFLRCAIYDNIINIDEYVAWYKIIMNYINDKVNEIIMDFDNCSYEEFLSKYDKLIKVRSLKKPSLLVINHALLPLTDIWSQCTLSIFLTGDNLKLINRFLERENLLYNKKKYDKDILRHLSLYEILNKNVKANIYYDTTKYFMNSNLIKIKKEITIMKSEVKFKTNEYNYYNRAVGIIKFQNKFLIMNVDEAPYYHIPGGHIEIGETSYDAVVREIKEELNYSVKSAKLFCVQENFYKKKEILQHGVEFYYLIEVKENIIAEDKNIVEMDRGEEKHLFIKWVTKEEMADIDLRPFTVKDLIITDKLNSLSHIIKQDL